MLTFSAFLSPQTGYHNLQLNTGQVGGSHDSDLNVEPAWIQGITGKGVVVAVVDDGELHKCLYRSCHIRIYWRCLTLEAHSKHYTMYIFIHGLAVLSKCSTHLRIADTSCDVLQRCI